MKLDPFTTYSLFIALKNHFSQPTYDYFKYNGKTNVKKSTFEKRPDRTQFIKLANKYEPEELEHFLVANFVHGRTWIGDFLTQDAERTFHAYARRKDDFIRIMSDEVRQAVDEVGSPQNLFTAEEGEEYPAILHRIMDGSLCHDTLIVLNQFVKFSEIYDERYGTDDILWGKIRFTCQRLKPFILYDRNEVKQALKEVLL